MDLTDEQWAALESLVPAQERAPPGPRGGRPYLPARTVMNGAMWILRTGAPWADLPRRYGAYSTVFKRYQAWVDDGIFTAMLRVLAEHLRDEGKLDLSEAFIDGTHAGAKKGAFSWEKLVAALPPRSWRSQTAVVFLYLPPSLRVSVTARTARS